MTGSAQYCFESQKTIDANIEEGFYMTMSSNASLNVFTENTISDYWVELAQHVDLEGPWKVALTEIL